MVELKSHQNQRGKGGPWPGRRLWVCWRLLYGLISYQSVITEFIRYCFPIVQEQEWKEALFHTPREEFLEASTFNAINILGSDCTNVRSPQNYHITETKLYDFITCIST